MSHLPDPTADGQQVKREGGLWRQQGLLWDIGAAFVESDADDLDATVEWALEKLATSVQGTSASIWRAEPSASESTVHWRWVRSEGLDLGPDARLEARHEVAAALAKTDGAAILALEALVGEEAVAEHGWTGGIGAVVVVDITEDEVVTLVVASLEPDWGDTELLYFRGFGTLLRQFLARVRAEKALDYRLQLEDLVSSSVGQLVSLDAEGWDETRQTILEQMQRRFAAQSTLVLRVDPRGIQLEGSAGALGDEQLATLKAKGMGALPPIPGLRLGAPEPSVLRLVDLVESVHGAEVVESLPIPEDANIAVVSARIGEDQHVVLAVIRDTEEWLPAELDAMRTITSAIAQTRARLHAEASSAHRLRIQNAFGDIAARFLRVDSRFVDEAILGGLTQMGEEAGADVVQLVELDEAQHHSTRVDMVWSRDSDSALVKNARVVHPDSGFSSSLYGGEAAVTVLPIEGMADSPINGALVGSPDGLWTTIGAPVQGRKDGLAAVIMIWKSDQSEHAGIYLRLVSALADMLGQLRARASFELKTQRQAAAQALLRGCAVDLAEAGESEFEAALGSVFQRVREFVGAVGITNWRVDHETASYRRLHRSCADSGCECPDVIPFEGRSSLDRCRSGSARVIEEWMGPGGPDGSMVVHSRGDRAGVHALLDVRFDDGQLVGAEDLEVIEAANRMVGQIEQRVSAERYSTGAFEAAPIGIVLRDENLRLITSNTAFLSFIGADSVDDVVGTLPHEVIDEEYDQIAWAEEGDTYSTEVAFRRCDGGRVWGQLRNTPIQGIVSGERLWLVHVEDITDRRRAEQLLRFQATHDELTGLANRRRLLDQTDLVLSGEGSVAMLLLDLDRFKLVNDSLGHDKGDELLVVVADRLRLAVRPGDLVARLGGDEFAVMLPGPIDLFSAQQVAERLLRLVGEPVAVDHQQLFPSASIGIALGGAGTKVADLVRRADTAMYRAKAQGRSRHATFDERLREEVVARMDTEAGLRRALREHELCVHYQPELLLRDRTIVGAEALVRWQHPERGLLAAGQFIGVAEETGLVVEIGEFVLRSACEEASGWPGGVGAGMLRVNMAAAQLQRDETVALVEEVLADTGLEPHRLCLEITESAVMADVDRAEAILHCLKGLGVRLAVDDFGTGFSSLAYLKRFPVDALKIDREFVLGLGGTDDDNAFVRSILSLADALGLEVVAEGVEEEFQVEALLRLGCHRAQGFLLGRPDEASVLRSLMIEDAKRPRSATSKDEAHRS